jgi:CubicO group peptidase (beta-lactamase class C family)
MDMTRRNWMGFASVLALGGAAAARAPMIPPSIRTLNRGARDPAPLLAALAAYAQAEMTAFGLPGLTMAVAGPDGLRATIALGHADLDRNLPVRPDQLFQIGSISKSMVALCLFHLADQGKLDLDAKAASILPDVAWPDADITVAMLLNHTAGLPADAPTFPRSPGGKHWTNYPSGKRFSYSNTAFCLLGMMVAKVSGMPFHRAMRDFVHNPLGMAHAQPLILTRDRARYPMSYVPFGNGVYFPGNALTPGPWLDIELAAGSVAATPEDMARYIAYLTRVGQGKGAPIMSDALAKRYARPTIAAEEFGPNGQYACGIATVELDGRQCLHHTGGMITFHSSITVDPLAGGGVFASTNSGAGDYRPRRITFYGCRLLRAFAEGKPLPAAPKLVPVPPVKDAGGFAGRFIAANGDTIAITARGEALFVSADGLPGRLMMIDKGKFAVDHPRLADHEIAFVEGRDAKDRLWWGGTLYGRDKAVPTPAADPGVAALAGLYVSDSPWIGGLSLVTRGDRLVIEGVGPLKRAEDGSWRAEGEAMPAERFWFEAVNDGRPERLVFSGTDLRRFHTVDD